MNFSVASAYIIGVVVSIVILGISALVANSIAFQIGADRSDITKRKVWFWILAVLVPVLTFAIGYFAVYSDLKIPSQKTDYMTALSISAGLSTVLYIVLGFVLSKIFKNGKIGNWF